MAGRRRIGWWVPALAIMLVVILAIFLSNGPEDTPVPVPPVSTEAPAADGLNPPLKPPS